MCRIALAGRQAFRALEKLGHGTRHPRPLFTPCGSVARHPSFPSFGPWYGFEKAYSGRADFCQIVVSAPFLRFRSLTEKTGEERKGVRLLVNMSRMQAEGRGAARQGVWTGFARTLCATNYAAHSGPMYSPKLLLAEEV